MRRAFRSPSRPPARGVRALVERRADHSAGLQLRSMSVTSSGRSSISRMKRYESGLFLMMALATFCNKPSCRCARRDDQSARAFAMGQPISTASKLILRGLEMKRLVGKSGSDCRNASCLSPCPDLMADRFDFQQRKKRSFSFGGRSGRDGVAVCKSKRRICEGET